MNDVKAQEAGPDSIELFIEDQAFSPSYDLAPPPPPLYRRKLNRQHKERHLADGRWGGGESVGRSQILQRQEGLVLYKHSILSGQNTSANIIL
jgi:hypothetical protein